MTSISEPLDGTEHLDYILGVIQDGSVTSRDFNTLRDRPDILSHIKSIYNIFMQNRAIFADRLLNDLAPGFYKCGFPKGRIKLFEDKDYTFSYTELSDFGLNSGSFKELYASIGCSLPLSVREFSVKLKIFNNQEKTLENFILPEGQIATSVYEALEDEERVYFDSIEQYFDVSLFNRQHSEGFFNIVKGIYSQEDLITYLKSITVTDYVMNYSLVDYDTSWNEVEPCLTREACEAFIYIKLLKKLSKSDFELYSKSYDYLGLDFLSKIAQEFNSIYIRAPGSLLLAEQAISNLENSKPTELTCIIMVFLSLQLSRVWFNITPVYLGEKTIVDAKAKIKSVTIDRYEFESATYSEESGVIERY